MAKMNEDLKKALSFIGVVMVIMAMVVVGNVLLKHEHILCKVFGGALVVVAVISTLSFWMILEKIEKMQEGV